MGISNDVITNRLDKKINYGFARTAFDSDKSISAETLTSPIPNPSHNLWMDSDLIPSVPPLTNTSEVAVYKYNSSASQGSSVGDVEGVFEFTVDGTVQNKRSWIMHSTPGDSSTPILTDWIRVTYGAQYFPQFKIGPSGASGNTDLTAANGYTPIYPVGVDGKEYYFDFEAGLLVFCGTTSPDTFIGNGISVYMTSGYKYVGVKGFKNANWNSIVTIDYSQLSIPDTPWLTRVAEVNDPVTNIDSANVHTLLFDVDSGFALDENNPGEITVRMESTFKTWKVYEDSDSLTSDDIIAQAVDTISLFGGNGIKLDAVTTTGNKSLTVNYDSDFTAPLSDLALNAKTFETNEYERIIHEDGDVLVDQDFNDIMNDLKTGAYYLDYTNFTNVPFGLANTEQVTTLIDKPHVDALLIDAAKLDGQDGNFYRDYNNLNANVPSIPANIGDFAEVDSSASGTGLANSVVLLWISNTSLSTGGSWKPSTLQQVAPSVFSYQDYGNVFANLLAHDGPGSGWNSDKLDDYEGTYYLNYLNFTNTPTHLEEFSNVNTKYQNDTQVDAAIIAKVDGTFVTNLTGVTADDSVKLDTKDASFYLDYDNFTDTPTHLEEFDNTNTDFQNSTQVDAAIIAKVNNSFINNLTIDADTIFGGKDKTDLYAFLENTPTHLEEFDNTNTDFQSETEVDARINSIVTTNYLNLKNIDAFTLNGNTATDLLDYSQHTNTPTHLEQFSNVNTKYQNDTQVDAAIVAKVNNSFINNLTIDADTLGTFDLTNLYSNLDGIPTNLNEFSNVDTNFQSETEVDARINAVVNDSFISNLNVDADMLSGKTLNNLYGFLNGTPTNLSDFTDDIGIMTSSQVSALITRDYVDNLTGSDGKGINADKLDNKEGSFYRDYGNLFGTPSNLSDFTDDIGIVTSSNITTVVSQSYINGLNVDAETLNDENASYYLDYSKFTGTPQDVSEFNNDAEYQTLSDVTTAINNLVDSAPEALNTLNELSAALGDDANFSATVTNQLALKADVSILGNIDARKFKHLIKLTTYDGDTIIDADNGIILMEETEAKFSDFYLDYTNLTNVPFGLANTENVSDIVSATYVENLGIDPVNLSISIDNMTDVDISTDLPAPGQTLVWHGANQKFVPETISGGSGGGSQYANTMSLGIVEEDLGQTQLDDGASVLINDETSVSEAVDILNETLLNIRNETYVRDAIFNKTVTSDESGHTGHFHSPLTVSFDSSVSDTTSTTLTHLWEFEHTDLASGASGSTQTSSDANPNHTWQEVGTFKVTHTLTAGGARFPGSAGSFSRHIDYVTVTPPLPIPQFNVNITSDVREWNGFRAISLDGGGTSCTFTNTSDNANRFMWDMGDGTVYPAGAVENDPLGNSGTAWTSVFDITHTFSGTVDTQFTVKLHAFHTDHSDSASDHCISEIKTNYISGYVPVTPTFDTTTLQGNNQAPEDNVALGNANLEGHKVQFTDTTIGLGSGFGQSLQWKFSPLTSDAPDIQDPNGGTGTTASASLGGNVTRYFKRDNLSAPILKTFEVRLLGINGHLSSPFESTAKMVMVNKDPRSDFTYSIVNNPTGHSSYSASNVGFNFVGYDGLNYGIFQFTDNSQNVNNWSWDYDNDGTAEDTSETPGPYTYTAPGTYSVSLIATGTTSETATDDTEIKNNIIQINPAPPAPSGLTGKTISLPSSEGISPAICATTTDNSGGSMPSAGTSVRRIIDATVDSSVLSGFANMFPSNGNNSGTLNSFINGSVDSSVAFTTSTNVGTTGSLEITAEQDANVSSPSTYPLNFYKQYKAKISKANSPGYNTYQLTHSDGTSSNEVGWVQDDLTDVPTCLNYGVAENTANYRYMSGIPYYNSGSSVDVTGLQIINITGQTYNSSGPFITVDSGGAGTALTTQTFDYTAGLGSAIPNAGLTSATNINNLTVNLNGSGVGTDVLKIKSKNVNGESAFRVDNQEIKYWFSSPSIDETNMTAFSSVLKRVDLGSTGATPSYTASDFVSTSAWNSQTSTIVGTDEAVVLPDGIKHDETDYSTFLPVGPDYSSGRSGTQYFTVGFNKPQLSKFGINLTGEITSMHIALPGTDLDTTSGLSGWFDASQVIGGGKPGTNGGNGSNAIGQAGNNAQLNQSGTQLIGINFGTWNSSKPGNQNNCILIRIGIASGKSVTSLSVTSAP